MTMIANVERCNAPVLIFNETKILKLDENIEEDAFLPSENPIQNLEVHVTVSVYKTGGVYWLDVYMESNDIHPPGDPNYLETIFQGVILADGNDCFEHMPTPSDNCYSMSICDHIKSIFTVWLERKHLKLV